MTTIQNTCIPHALVGRDILGAAKTGSGKTLSFLIPTLEQLYRARFRPQTGPGAIILSPTRELSIQIFSVLRSIGSHHDLSAGLLTGGKKEFRTEQTHVGRTNIIVATPGRLLQHLEQTPYFDVQEVMILVLDEADRILDMGFSDQLKRILDYLPPHRQTMLFSATQTKNVKDLARLSFREKPEYLFVHDHETTKSSSTNENNANSSTSMTQIPTPDSLKEQNVLICPLPHKMSMIFSFLKSHLNKKTIIFFSSCAQVRQVHAIFCALQPGIPIMALHGKIKQHKRTKIYFDFCDRGNKGTRKTNNMTSTHRGAALFATDLAARGLDFPDVDWVLQADAPEDKETYIHRVGRTARFNSGGRSLMLLLPSEQAGMMKLLTEANIPLKKISMNPHKAISISQKAASIVASNPPIKELAKKAFISYLRSIYLMPNKDIFKVDHDEMDLDGYASSLGLASTPSTRFLKKVKGETREDNRAKKNVSKKLQRLKEQIKAEKLQKKIAKMNDEDAIKLKEQMERKKRQSIHDDSDEDDDSDDDLLMVKRHHAWEEKTEQEPKEQAFEQVDRGASKRPKRIRIEGNSTYENNKITFDDDGNEKERHADIMSALESSRFEKKDKDSLAVANEEYIRKVKERLSETRDLDDKEEKERIREKRRKKKMKEKEMLDDDYDGKAGEEVQVTLGGYDENRNLPGDDSNSDSSDDGSDTDDDDEMDLKAQEDLALSLMRSR